MTYVPYSSQKVILLQQNKTIRQNNIIIKTGGSTDFLYFVCIVLWREIIYLKFAYNKQTLKSKFKTSSNKIDKKSATKIRCYTLKNKYLKQLFTNPF